VPLPIKIVLSGVGSFHQPQNLTAWDNQEVTWLKFEKTPFRKRKAGSFGQAFEAIGRKWVGFLE